ncbi:MAG TPA: thioredoxin family protein, partial [bacterium]|nr:thioredoxin family protein [bacterium]
KLQERYTGKEVVWLTVNSSARGKQGFFEGDSLQRQLREEKIASTAYLLDTDGRVGREYGAKTTPHMYVISPDGTLIYAGAIDDKPSTRQSHIAVADNYVEKALNNAMSGNPVPVKATAPYGCSVKY